VWKGCQDLCGRRATRAVASSAVRTPDATPQTPYTHIGIECGERGNEKWGKGFLPLVFRGESWLLGQSRIQVMCM